jgi:non-ribosomal peptide synthase protein (TIGR01720 family)
MLRFIHNHKYVNQRIPLQEEGDISFNYLGDNDAPYNQSEIFTVAQEDTGSRLDPRAEGPYKLGLFSYISGGRIQGNWWFNLGIYKPQTIEALTVAFQQNLRRLL